MTATRNGIRSPSELTHFADALLTAASEDALQGMLDRLGVVGKRWYAVVEAAEYLGRSKNGVYHLIESRQLRCSRAGGRVMLDREDMDQFMLAGKRG